MVYSKIFSKQILSEQLVSDINRAISTIYSLSTEEYNSSLFHDLAVGFKSIVYNMDEEASVAFPLFLKWLKLYVTLQHQIDPNNGEISKKFEKRIPVCTSYIVAALQYQTNIANYHLQVLEMCLSLFNSAPPEIMSIIANLDIELIALFWMPIEFVGDYNTQKMSLHLIVKVLKYLNESEKRQKVAQIETSQDIRNLLLRLTVDNANFEMISRELLNNFNMKTTKCCAVFSVYCSAALFGGFNLYKPAKIDKFWIDFNYTSKSVSFLCEIKQSEEHLEEFAIEIKIDRLQIDNQFDCIVFSLEPATFSTDVSTELKNARLAVFTLPKSEIKRLNENRDLLDFYNKSYNYAYSESEITPTPNTIDDYLAESYHIADDSPKTPQSQDSGVMKSLAVVLPKLSLNELLDCNRSNKPTNDKPSVISPKKGNDLNNNLERPLHKSVNAERALPNSFLSNKESGYNTGVSAVNQDLTIFKKPSKPVRKKTKQNKLVGQSSKSVENVKKIKPMQKQKSPPRLVDTNPLASQSIPSSCGTSRRFFKVNLNKQANTLPKRTNKSNRKKLTNTNTGISPMRKQVNTVKPLNHLTKPDCDPEEATIEFVENGGYTNIISFLQSNAGSTRFSVQQRKHILANVKRISEDLERSNKRFIYPDAGSDTDSGSIWKTTTRRRKKKATLKVAEVADFVPYSMWKTKQKEKTNGQSTMLAMQQKQQNQQSKAAYSKAPVNAFDQLKASSFEAPCSKPIKKSVNKTAVADNRSISSSASSRSNHNFHIAESDNELIRATSDEDIMSVDMICRREPVDMNLTSIPVPIEDPMKLESQSSDDSLSSSKMPVTLNVSSVAGLLVHNTAPMYQSSQMSEIYEDIGNLPQDRGIRAEKSQAFSVSLSSSLEQPLNAKCPQADRSSNRTTIPGDVRTQSEQNQDPNSTWYTEKYLTEQQLYNPPPCRDPNVSTVCFDTPEQSSDAGMVPQNITTNQVIIQNQFVVSTARKRMMPPDYEESPLAKRSSGEQRVSLRGYSRLLPTFVEQVTREKDRLLKELEFKLQEDYFDTFNEVADEIMESIKEDEIAIKEAQEQLASIYGKLEWIIEDQQKKKFKLEAMYCQLISHIRVSLASTDDINEAYNDLIDKLNNYATYSAAELWQNFANGIVSSIEGRLRGLVNF